MAHPRLLASGVVGADMTHYIPAPLLLLSLLVLPAQAVTKPAPKSEIAWKMVKVRHGRFQAPHLTRYRDPKVVKSVNRQIDAIIADLGCGPEKEGKDGLEIGTSVKLAARDIFSVYISGSYFCGTYPENDDKRSTTFDLRDRTARRIRGAVQGLHARPTGDPLDDLRQAGPGSRKAPATGEP